MGSTEQQTGLMTLAEARKVLSDCHAGREQKRRAINLLVEQFDELIIELMEAWGEFRAATEEAG